MSACNVGHLSLIPGSGRSTGEGNDNPLKYSCLEIPWTEKPGGLHSMGPQRVGHNLVTSLTYFMTKLMSAHLKIEEIQKSFKNIT